MDTSTARPERQAPMGHGEIPEPLAGPAAPPARSDAPSTWELMRGDHPREELHPYWVHTVTASGVTLLAAALLSLMSLAWWAWVLTFVLLVFMGGMLGAALTWRASEMITKMSQAATAAWGAGIGGLALLMQDVGFVGGMWEAAARPAWLAWAAIALMGSIVHRYIWGRVVEISDPTHPRGIEYRKRRNRGLWEDAFERAGFGHITVENVTENWCGVDVVIRTDPNKATSAAHVRAKADQIVDYAHKALREDGQEEGLGLGEAEVTGPYGGQRDRIRLRVRTRDPLAETIAPAMPSPAEWTITDSSTGMLLGYWDTGEDLVVPASGPHTFGVGTTASGKSTWLISLQVGYARRPHWTMWAAGTAKLMDLMHPVIAAAERVGGRPIFEMWGGGDAGTDSELYAAERVVAATYTLYRDRAARSGRGEPCGRVGRDFVGSAEHPWVALFLDEVNDLVKRSGDRRLKLPNGEQRTVWDMLVTLLGQGRAYGVELVMATQRATNSWFGGKPINDLITNANKRFVFRTKSSSDVQDILPAGEAVSRAKRLMDMRHACMATISGEANEYRYGKVALWTDEDLVEVTRLANELGTVGGLGEADRRALGDLYVQGAQPSINMARKASGQGDTSPWGAADRTEHRRQITDALLRGVGIEPRRSDQDAPTQAPEPAAPVRDETDAFEQQARAELDALLSEGGVLSEDDVEALRAEYAEQPHHPEDPLELLGAIVDAWDELDPRPERLTPLAMVQRFGLEWLDDRREDRAAKLAAQGEPEAAALEAVQKQAARRLGEIFRDALSLQPSGRTGAGVVYRLADLRAAYDKAMGAED